MAKTSNPKKDANTAWAIETDKLLVPVGWLILLIISFGVAFLRWERGDGILLLGFLLLGIVTNVFVARLRIRGVSRKTINIISAFAHGTISVLGLLLTGGVNSRFTPLFTLAMATIPMRFPVRSALLFGTFFIAAFAVGNQFVPNHSDFGALTIFICLNFLSLLMASSLVRRNEVSQARFLQTAAHELRNPMAVIKGILSLQRRRLDAGKPLGDIAVAAETMEREVDRLALLVNEVMEAFLIREGQLLFKRECIALDALIASTLDAFLLSSEASRIVYAGADLESVCILGDAKRLSEVVQNLVGNALKYAEGSQITVGLRTANDKAVVFVQDNGPGIPRAHQAKVFDPFYRVGEVAGRDPGGIGLGLFICQSIVQQHKGRIWVESEEAHGATFFVELPLYRQKWESRRNRLTRFSDNCRRLVERFTRSSGSPMRRANSLLQHLQ